MPKIIFTVDIPSLREGSSAGQMESSEWLAFSHAANTKIEPVSTATMLQKNCWLLGAENQLPLLSELVALAKSNKLSYSALLIPDGAVMLALDQK